jgi:hypothetical protein
MTSIVGASLWGYTCVVCVGLFSCRVHSTLAVGNHLDFARLYS